MNLVEEGKDTQPIFINVRLSRELTHALLNLLREYKDVFACIYAEIHRLNP